MTLHGVSRKETVKATITYIEGNEDTKKVMPGNLVTLNASFRVALADYNIERPKALFLKVGDVVDITLVARLTDSPDSAGDGCGGCGGCGGGKCGGGKCGG
jgi:hypothetical protein